MSALECRELEPLLQAYVDGEFEAVERAEFDAHLGQCPACRERVMREQAFREQLRAAASVRAPAALRARIESGLKQERRWGAVRKLVRPEVVAALAACAGFVAYFSSQRFLEPLLKDAVSNHAHNLPIEVSGDEQHVQSWFSGKVDFPVRLPHLRDVSVSGGRLSHVRDRSAAYVVYQGPRAHRVSLFVFDDPRAPLEMGFAGHTQRVNDREILLANERGYNVAMWRDNEIVYSLVSDLDERDIVELLDGRTAGPAQLQQVEAPTPTPSVQPAALQLQH